jgi:hypothetical protein
MRLNKAYRVIVEEQSFVDGRMASVRPVGGAHETIEEDQETGVTEPLLGY